MRAQFFLGKSDPTPPPTGGSEPVKKRKNPLGTVLIILLILALFGGLGYMGKLYWDTQNKLKAIESAAAGNVTNLTQSETQALIEEVGRHIMLPKEKPQVVTITNVDQLKIGQPFFNSAQNGDKLLVYLTKVILYRASIDKVIDTALILAPATSPTRAASASAQSTAATVAPTPLPSKAPPSPTPTI